MQDDVATCPHCGSSLVDLTTLGDKHTRFGMCPCRRIATSHTFGPALMKALGLEGQMVTGLTLHVQAGGAAVLHIERLLTQSAADALAAAIVAERFALVPLPAARAAGSVPQAPEAPRTSPARQD